MIIVTVQGAHVTGTAVALQPAATKTLMHYTFETPVMLKNVSVTCM
jgi:hypothetical protein